MNVLRFIRRRAYGNGYEQGRFDQVMDDAQTEHHCPTCECIHQPCGAVIGSAACVEFHEDDQ